jgi:electron transport complex protein RnfE
LFGLVAADWEIELLPGHEGFLLALLPPGAFIGLGLLIAMKNLVDEKMDSRRGSLDTPGHCDLHDSPP